MRALEMVYDTWILSRMNGNEFEKYIPQMYACIEKGLYVYFHSGRLGSFVFYYTFSDTCRGDTVSDDFTKPYIVILFYAGAINYFARKVVRYLKDFYGKKVSWYNVKKQRRTEVK